MPNNPSDLPRFMGALVSLICDAIPIPIPIPYAININYFGLMTFATVTNYGIFVHAAVGVCVCVVYISTYINICALNNLSGLSNAQCTVNTGSGLSWRWLWLRL